MSLADSTVSPVVSVLVPAKDEAENLTAFVEASATALEALEYPCEVIIVDDGSADRSGEILTQLAREHTFLHIATHRAQRGIAEALQTASRVARGEIFVFYPADLQYHPTDIAGLVEPIRTGAADVVTGTKQGQYEKALVSRVYNTLCRWLFGIRVTDLNSVKAFRREVMASVPMRPDWHRYMVVIASMDGFTLAERPVPLHPRRAGVSKFGLGRIPVGLADLIAVWFQLRFGRKPLLFFGSIGAMLFGLGFVTGVIALIFRFGFGMGFRPLLDLVLVLTVSGVALFGFGFVGELLAGMREELKEMQNSLDELRRRE